jgi:hypothetical protein
MSTLRLGEGAKQRLDVEVQVRVRKDGAGMWLDYEVKRTTRGASQAHDVNLTGTVALGQARGLTVGEVTGGGDVAVTLDVTP